MNQVNWKYILIILVLAIIVGGGIFYWSNQQEIFFTELISIKTQEDISDWKTYGNEEYGFEFKYPKELVVKNKSDKHFILGLDGVENTSTEIPTLSFSIDLNPNELDFKEYYDGDPGIDIIGHSDNKFSEIKINNYQAYKLIPYITLAGDILIVIPQKNYFIHINNSIYMDEKGMKIFDQILSSFRFIESVDTSDWQTYRNEKYDFEIKLPPRWEDAQIEETYNDYYGGDNVIFKLPLENSEDYRIVCHIAIYPKENWEHLQKDDITGKPLYISSRNDIYYGYGCGHDDYGFKGFEEYNKAIDKGDFTTSQSEGPYYEFRGKILSTFKFID